MKLKDIQQLVRPACEQYGVDRLELFGSQATGQAVPSSDFDFLVTFRDAEQVGVSDRYFGLLFFLEDNLETSIDLLDGTAVRNPFLRQSIECHKVAIYERDRC